MMAPLHIVYIMIIEQDIGSIKRRTEVKHLTHAMNDTLCSR